MLMCLAPPNLGETKFNYFGDEMHTLDVDDGLDHTFAHGARASPEDTFRT